MRNRRRQADLPIEEPESTFLGPKMDAMIPGNAPAMLGDLREDPYPTDNPFWRYENMNKVGGKKESESQGEREARLARRLLVLLKGPG